MAEPKPLHMARDMDALQEQFKLPTTITNKKVMMLCKSANNMKQIADKHYAERPRDEENSFLCYMKYLNIMNIIKKHPEYENNKRAISEALGAYKDIEVVYEKLEKLNKSLYRRYEEQNKRETTKCRSLQDNVGPLILQEKHRITPKELFEMIQNNQLSMLIIDCRSEEDFESSQIKYEYVVNVPDNLLVAGMTAGKIHDKLPANCKPSWTSRKVKEQIVLMDNDTKGSPPKDTPLWVLENILLNWDPDVTYKKPFLIVNGGFMEFVMHYPMYCTNPNYSAVTNEQSDNPRFEDIEYPNISDIRMKDDSYGLQPGRPAVDRNSKAAALHIYEAKTKVEILDEREKLVDKSIQNEQEMLTAENELKKIHAIEAQVAEDEKNELRERADELTYHLIQLQDSQKDILSENHLLKDQIRYYEEKELKEKGERISSQQAVADEKQVRKRIQEKEEYIKRLDLQLAKFAQDREEYERERKRKAQHEHKRMFKENLEERDKKIPQFDRSAKPANALSDYNHNVQREVKRDFAPVFGNVWEGLRQLMDPLEAASKSR